jgi:hypothetical protein
MPLAELKGRTTKKAKGFRMREERRLPKIPETAEVPQDLFSFLADVHQMILDESEEATIESDDLLQCEYAYGGLEDSATGVYSFTYFPDKQGTRNTWEFALSKSEMERIAKGEITELNLWACKDSACGCKFSSESGSCFYCDWLDAPSEA